MATESTTRYTYEDYVLLPDDGRRHEVIDGEHYVSPSPKTKHQSISRNLEYLIMHYLQERRTGHLFSAPYDVVLTDFDVVQPDMIYVASDRAAIITDDNIRGVPDLVVEILSESTRKTDEVIKRKLYERSGVSEYWVLDPVLDTAKVYRRRQGAFERVAELSLEKGDSLSTPLLPEFEAPLERVFTGR